MLQAVKTDEIQQLWEEFVSTRTAEIRDRLLFNYLPLVKQVAGRLKTGLPGSVEFDDLVSAGLMGLINSLDNFNPSKGFKFETFAAPRIKGSILDGLRDTDWLPRSYRQKNRKLDNALTTLINKLGRTPDDDEIAASLGMNEEEYYKFITQVGTASLVSMDVRIPTGEEGESGSLHDVISDSSSLNPYDEIEENDAKATALKLLKEMSEQDRAVVALYYFEELTFKEIGKVLGVSESRICQIHTKIISILRVKLLKLLE